MDLKLNKLLGSTIHFRDSVEKIFLCEYKGNVNVDFSGVSFIGRSPADQVLHEQKRLEKQGVEVNLINLFNSDVKSMLELVRKTRNNQTTKSIYTVPESEISNFSFV